MNCLGIIAGKGGLPIMLAKTCHDHHRPFVVLAFEGLTDPLAVAPFPHVWCVLTKVGPVIEAMKGAGVTSVVLAGAFPIPSLRHLGGLDMKGLSLLRRIGIRWPGEDAVLRILTTFIEEHGFVVCSVGDVMGRVLCPAGVLGSVPPNVDQWEDIKKGQWALGLTSVLDIGQAVVVQNGLILGIEAAEGTDNLIARCGLLKKEGSGPLLVKMPKTSQDMRLDLPTVGSVTVMRAVQAGFSGIAVGAGTTLLLDQKDLVERADSAGIFVVGV